MRQLCALFGWTVHGGRCMEVASSVKRSSMELRLALLLVGCSGPQSTLQPEGPSASSIHQLGTLMHVAAALVAILVTALILLPVLRPRQRPVNQKLFLWG